MVHDNILGMKCIKYLLLGFNSMFVLTSVLVLSIGTSIYAIYHDIRFFVHESYFSPASLLIAIGFIMLFVSLFGCIGAARESTCLINIYTLLLGIIFILEIVAAIGSYACIGDIKDYVGERFYENLEHYHEDLEIQHSVDLVQKSVLDIGCCGVTNYGDWESTEWYDKNKTYPLSCYNEDKIYEEGCWYYLVNIITQSAMLLGTGALTISFIQCMGIIFSAMLGKAIRQAKSERERRRWEIREQMINSYAQMEKSTAVQQKNYTPVIYVPTTGTFRA